MKLLYLEVENFKRIVVAKVKRSGNVMNITGRNGQGKSSLLDAIQALLGGKDAAPLVPIHVGADSATLRGHLGDTEVEFVVTRTFEHDANGEVKHSLRVTRPDSKTREAKGQTLLDEFYGALSFDVAAFLNMKQADQLKIVRQFVDVDFDALTRQDACEYDARTDINRDIKRLEAQFLTLKVPEFTPENAVDVADLAKQIETAGAFNAKIEERKKKREDVRRDIAGHLEMIEQAEKMILDLEARVAAAKLDIETRSKTIADLDAKLKAAPELPAAKDISELSAQMQSASRVNEGIRIREQKAAVKEEIAGLVKQSEDLTAAMEARKEFIKDAVAKAKLPVPDLGFGENGITLSGIPFEQASFAEKLKVSVGIGMKLNPKLRILLIREASLFDRDSKKYIFDLAKANDFDVWLESVSDGKADAESFTIEDGVLVTEGQA